MKKIDQKGQVLIFVTLTFVVLGLFVGMVLDFGRGYLERARLSRTVDAVAIAAANALLGQPAFEPQAVAAGCGAAAMNGMSNCGGPTSPLTGGQVGCEAEGLDVSVCFVDVSVTGGPPMRFVNVSGRSSIPTTFLRLLTFVGAGDFTTLPVGVSAQGGPARPVDLMLVLDRSGSMSETDGTGATKLAALQCALTGLGCGGIGFLDQAFSGNDRIGMTSFGRRGCAVYPYAGSGEFTGDTCVPNVQMNFMSGGHKNTLENAIDTLPFSGTTITMEGLHTARQPIIDAFNDASRATSRKAILLITDGQPTALRLTGTAACEQDPVNYPNPGPTFVSLGADPALSSPWSDSDGCTFVKIGNSTSVAVSTGLNRVKLNNTQSPPPPNNTFALGNTLYQHMMWAARNAARDEANALRNLGGGNVVIFVIGIGEPTPTDTTARLDANAKCLLGLIANDPTVINDPSTNNQTGGCGGVYSTASTDGDPRTDLMPSTSATPGGTPRAFQQGQQVGKLYTVNMSNVAGQLQTIFGDIAAILKLRLTV